MPLDALRLTRDHEAVINAVNDFRGVKYDYEVRNAFEARYNFYPDAGGGADAQRGLPVRAARD